MQFKNLNRYRNGGTRSKPQLGVPVPKTPDGRVYRFSPNENAHPRHFVLGDANRAIGLGDAGRSRMKLDPGSEQTVCPYSGIIAEDDAFTHPEDQKAAVEIVRHAVMKDVEDEFARMFSGFSRGQSRNSFIKIDASVQKRYRPKPRFARRDLMRELVCDHCGRDYGVFAIGLFCPDCGAPNLRLHFAREVELVGAQIDLADGLNEAQEELAYRILGNAHEDVLTAFEATQKTVYLYGMAQRPAGSPAVKAVKNDFQNIDRGKARLAELALDPFDTLSPEEVDLLALNIQKRHVIGHNLGIMDEKFAAMASNAKVGETVQIVGEDIRVFAMLCQKVIDNLDTWLGGTPSPTIGLSITPAIAANLGGVEPMSDEESRLKALDLGLSQLARQVGLWIAQNDADGMASFVSSTELKAAFGDTDEAEIIEALAELELDGYVEQSRTLGAKFTHVRPTNDLYLTFDPIALDTDPYADAAQIIEKILAGTENVNVSQLHASMEGWSPRRFNPALKLVISEVDSRHVSRQIQAAYPTAHLIVDATDKVALRRLLQRLQG